MRSPPCKTRRCSTTWPNRPFLFIETTMIGNANFNTAVKTATSEWEEAKPHIDASEERYGWVTIPDQRKDGILPLPWK